MGVNKHWNIMTYIAHEMCNKISKTKINCYFPRYYNLSHCKKKNHSLHIYAKYDDVWCIK